MLLKEAKGRGFDGDHQQETVEQGPGDQICPVGFSIILPSGWRLQRTLRAAVLGQNQAHRSQIKSTALISIRDFPGYLKLQTDLQEPGPQPVSHVPGMAEGRRARWPCRQGFCLPPCPQGPVFPGIPYMLRWGFLEILFLRSWFDNGPHLPPQVVPGASAPAGGWTKDSR